MEREQSDKTKTETVVTQLIDDWVKPKLDKPKEAKLVLYQIIETISCHSNIPEKSRPDLIAELRDLQKHANQLLNTLNHTSYEAAVALNVQGFSSGSLTALTSTLIFLDIFAAAAEDVQPGAQGGAKVDWRKRYCGLLCISFFEQFCPGSISATNDRLLGFSEAVYSYSVGDKDVSMDSTMRTILKDWKKEKLEITAQ